MTKRTVYTDVWKSFGVVFQDLKESVTQLPWYREQEWLCGVKQTDVQFNFILEKPNWSTHGLSLVTWIGGHELRSNNFKIALYIEPEIPHCKAISKILASQLESIASELNYRVSEKYTYILFKKIKPLNPDSYVKSVIDEFQKLMPAAKIIDSVIEEFDV